MGRHHTVGDLDVATLPRISKGVWRFSDRVYHWRCAGRTSLGYGTTPADAYNAWLRNWRRRLNFYKTRANNAVAYLRSVGR